MKESQKETEDFAQSTFIKWWDFTLDRKETFSKPRQVFNTILKGDSKKIGAILLY